MKIKDEETSLFYETSETPLKFFEFLFYMTQFETILRSILTAQIPSSGYRIHSTLF